MVEATGLATQKRMLRYIGLSMEKNKVNKLAEIICRGCFWLVKFSLGSAISSSDWVSSHEKYGRKPLKIRLHLRIYNYVKMKIYLSIQLLIADVFCCCWLPVILTLAKASIATMEFCDTVTGLCICFKGLLTRFF